MLDYSHFYGYLEPFTFPPFELQTKTIYTGLKIHLDA